MEQKAAQILIVKHGALGDIILATGPMKAIRQHHPDAHITLLTGKAFAKLVQDCPFVDEVVVDTKKLPFIWKFLHSRRWEWVYDLQTSDRSTWYYHLLSFPKPKVSGLSRCASHRHATPERTKLHTIDRQKQQLAIAGIEDVPAPDIGWLKGKTLDELIQTKEPRVGGNHKYALLVPGGSAHRPEKRWPGECYAELATWLISQDITPVLIGAGAEEGLLNSIQESVSGGQEKSLATEDRPLTTIVNLCNQTSYGDIAELACHAAFAVGNDTGPMHIIAATGCPSLVLFSHASNPDLCAPRGEHVGVVRVENLSQLPLDAVTAELKQRQMLDKTGR